MKKKVLILGVNGFIGSSLTEAILKKNRLGRLRIGRGQSQTWATASGIRVSNLWRAMS